MLQAQSLANIGFQEMQSYWKHKPTTKPTQLIFQAYADAFSTALVLSLKGVVINNGIISGGTSLPGGPVVGALMVIPPGSITSLRDLDLETVFKPPAFPGGSYTPWLRSFTSCINATAKTAFSNWCLTWSLPGAVVAGGGVSAWIPPTPTSTPLPGPWSGGTITTPFAFMAPGFGTNPSQDFNMLDSSFVLKGKSTNVQIKDGDKTHNLKLIATDEGEHLARTVAKGLAKIFDIAVSQVLVIDKSFLGVGTATPPVGSITGGTISNCTLDA